MRHAVQTYGALHLAVDNAGIGGPQAPAGETDLEAWDTVIGINLNGVLHGMRHQFPAMLEAVAERCAIVSKASIHRTVAALGIGAYTEAKHGVVAARRPPAEFRDALVQRHPLGRLGRPEEVAHLVCFLLSEERSFITGGDDLIDGGYAAV